MQRSSRPGRRHVAVHGGSGSYATEQPCEDDAGSFREPGLLCNALPKPLRTQGEMSARLFEYLASSAPLHSAPPGDRLVRQICGLSACFGRQGPDQHQSLIQAYEAQTPCKGSPAAWNDQPVGSWPGGSPYAIDRRRKQNPSHFLHVVASTSAILCSLISSHCMSVT